MKNSDRIKLMTDEQFADWSDIKVVGIGDNVEIDIPKPIASINFDAFHAGTYVVDVKQDGSYSASFVGSMYRGI